GLTPAKTAMAGTGPAIALVVEVNPPEAASAIDGLPAVIGRRRVEHRLEDRATAGGGLDRRRRERFALGGLHQLMLALALGRSLNAAAAALDRRQRATVEIVDVAAHLQLTGVVYERGLIGEMHPNRRRLQLNILLGAAEHPRDPRRRPMFLRPCD